jgi:chemotaxis protein MotA
LDFATIIGFIGGLGIIIAAIASGGDVMMFVDVPSVLIVVIGTFMVTLMQLSISEFLSSFKVAIKAFMNRNDNPITLIEKAVELAGIARKNGLLALEDQEVDNEFLKRGLSLCVDGHDAAMVQKLLSRDMNLAIERHEVGQNMWKSVGDMAPAMGMIGTLVGLVQMLANMADPAAIGPAMAVALLTTLYGAVIANAFALPMSAKLEHICNSERLNKALILETVQSIQDGMNPRVLETLLKTYLPESKRGAIGDSDDEA